jgi:hypothetical protein
MSRIDDRQNPSTSRSPLFRAFFSLRWRLALVYVALFSIFIHRNATLRNLTSSRLRRPANTLNNRKKSQSGYSNSAK